MTDGIGRIFGGNSYGVGGYVPQRKEEEAPQNKPAEMPVNNYEETQVDPNKVMDFLNANNIFAAPKATTPAELAPDVQERVVDAMERFEELYAIVAQEFGEENAPLVMDFAMDKLMGLV